MNATSHPIPDLAESWRREADEREARAANPDVVGVVEGWVEEMAVRTLRRCADELNLRDKDLRP